MNEKNKDKFELTNQDRLIELAGNAAAFILLFGAFAKIIFL